MRKNTVVELATGSNTVQKKEIFIYLNGCLLDPLAAHKETLRFFILVIVCEQAKNGWSVVREVRHKTPVYVPMQTHGCLSYLPLL